MSARISRCCGSQSAPFDLTRRRPVVPHVVAAPGTWAGRYPVGNTGGANVSAFAPMAVPADLQRLLKSDFEDAL